MGKRLAFLVLGLAGALGLAVRTGDAGSEAGADAAGTMRLPKLMVMRWTEGINIHIGHQEGAINRRGNVLLSVELLDGNKLRVSDSGTRSEHNLFSNYSTKEETTWRNSWSGTWVLTGKDLRLDLRLDDRTCKGTRTETGVAPKKLDCQTPSRKLRMECTSQQIELERWSGSPDAPVRSTTQQEVWACSPAKSGELGETPSRWVLAKEISCLQVTPSYPGRVKMTYGICPPVARVK